MNDVNGVNYVGFYEIKYDQWLYIKNMKMPQQTKKGLSDNLHKYYIYYIYIIFAIPYGLV